MVTRMAPQRQVEEMDSAKEEAGCEFGLPVNFEGEAMMSSMVLYKIWVEYVREWLEL
jgi:hypothetical protein